MGPNSTRARKKNEKKNDAWYEISKILKIKKWEITNNLTNTQTKMFIKYAALVWTHLFIYFIGDIGNKVDDKFNVS